jgi:hypothetical protein
MKKDTKHGQRRLALTKETIRQLGDHDLKRVNGGGSCLPFPVPPIVPLDER